MATTLTRPPLELAVGETSAWTVQNSDFDPVDGWALSYFFRGPASVDLVGVVDGSAFDFLVLEASFVTVGGYEWEAIAVNSASSERCRISSGILRLVANLEATLGTESVTTHNERMLGALEAALENTASSAQKSYSIAGRSLERMTLDELRSNRDIYARRVSAECELAAAGVSKAPRRVLAVLR